MAYRSGLMVKTFILINYLSAIGCEGTLADGMPSDIRCDACHRSDSNPNPVLYPDSNFNNGLYSDTDLSAASAQNHLVHHRSGVTCDACHLVPDRLDSPGHINGMPADVTFTGWGIPEGADNASWDYETKTCFNTYCHGTLLFREGKPNLKWTDSPSAGGLSCNDCHGQRGNPPQTGAHLRHDKYNIDCSVCHIVPITVGAVGHVDKPPSEVIFGAGSFSNFSVANYNYNTKRCENIYCHGATIAGGRNTNPLWQTPLSEEPASCDNCHGYPPSDDVHLSSMTVCYICHTQTLNEDETVNWANGFHINGVSNSDF